MIDWISYTGYAVLHSYIELAIGIGVGLSIALAAIMPFRARTYWRALSGGDDEA